MYSTESEKEITSILTSCILSYGEDGIPLSEIQDEFESLCGFPIPYKKFGCDNLYAFLTTLPNIYVVKDQFNNDIVIEYSPKLNHIKQLISRQKKSYKRKCQVGENLGFHPYKRSNSIQQKSLPKGVSIHSAINAMKLNDYGFQEFNKLVSA